MSWATFERKTKKNEYIVFLSKPLGRLVELTPLFN